MKLSFTKFLNCKKAATGLLLAAMFSMPNASFAGKKIRALFLGNSFTSTNNLPDLIKTIATTMGDTLEFESNSPGGFTLEQHSTDPSSLARLSAGTWNYIVLQEQSQKPAFPDAQVAVEVYPFAHFLDSVGRKLNPCARTMFYQTWGYKNGDVMNCATYPSVCTYKGMDTLIEQRYQKMTADNQAVLSPVGLVFREVRSSTSIELYMPDEMHPSEAGTYAAAVTFYAVMFRRDPMLVTFNFSLLPPDASQIRSIVSNFVYKKLPMFNVGKYDPKADFTASPSSLTANFDGSPAANAVNYNWTYGDGNTGTGKTPSHTYASAGTYNVRLIVDNCTMFDTLTKSVTVTGSGIAEHNVFASVRVFPNPASGKVSVVLPANVAHAELKLMNLLGQTVMQTVVDGTKELELNNVPSGMYMMHFTNPAGGQTAALRFVKQ